MKTLQELCLEQIVHVFDKHILAYSASTKLKSSYEVLRRRFSLEILQKLMEEYHEIKQEYVDFLINKYLKTLDTDWLDNCSWDVIEKKFPEIGPGLETVLFNDKGKLHWNLHWEDILCHLPNLKVVYFFCCEDKYLDCISKFCPKIESITLGVATYLSRKGFQYLCGRDEELSPCPRLKEITLEEPYEILYSFADTGFQPNIEDAIYLLKKLPSLEKINNFYKLAETFYSMHEKDINNLAAVKPYNLTNLDIPRYHDESKFFKAYDNVLKICLSLCPHLKTLACPVLNHDHLNLCSELTELQHLSLSNAKDSPIELNDFLKAKGSQLMSLAACKFSVSAAHLAETCPLLDTLELSRITFLNDDPDTVSEFCNLKNLTFGDMSMNENDTLTTKALTYILASSPHLELLIFKNCEVFSSDIEFEFLKRCFHGKIRHLSFVNSTIKSKFLVRILDICYSLESLILESSEIEGIRSREEIDDVISILPNKPKVIYRDMFIDSDDENSFYKTFYPTF